MTTSPDVRQKIVNPMGKIIATCGHEIADYNDGRQAVTLGTYLDPRGEEMREVSYSFVCPACFAEMKVKGLLATEEEADRWLFPSGSTTEKAR